MCGIAGILSFDGRTPDPDLVGRMTDRLAHRGPDDRGIHVAGCVGLGHRRLSILDLSSAGRQPMCTPDGRIWITYNGEVYNFGDLRRELESRGHRFRSRTDTEVVLHAYQEWDLACLERFNGMFAFGLWDAARQRLWLVRDRIGIKPLFYALGDRQVAFASEIKALLCDASLGRRLDHEGLAYYLATNWVPAPHTLLAGVRQLLPGHYLLAGPDGFCRDVAYWEMTFREDRTDSADGWTRAFDEQMRHSVARRLVSDVPFGVFLSGGLDSSSVAYWMSREMTRPVQTFSIAFDESGFDETPYARSVSRRIGAEHRERLVRAEAAEVLPRLVWHAEEPTADSSMIAVYHLAQVTRENVKMVLTGDGGDEILAGYETYPAYYAARLYRLLPRFCRRGVVRRLVGLLPVSDGKVSLDFKLRQFVAAAEHPPEDAHAAWRMIFDADMRRALLAPIWHEPGVRADVVDLYRRYFARTDARRPLNRMLYVDTSLYLPNDMLVKVDRMTMAHGLEARTPFLDHEVVAFAASLPPRLKLRRLHVGKYVLKRAMRGRLPAAVIARRKEGFNVPNARWIKQGLRPFVLDALSPRTVREMGILDAAAVAALLDDHFRGRADNSHRIWCLLTLALWWRQFLAGGQPP